MRTVLGAAAAQAAVRYMLHPPRLPHGGGCRLRPDSWELWRGRKSCRHSRRHNRLNGAQGLRERLAP